MSKKILIYFLLVLGITGILSLQSYLLYKSYIQSKVLEQNRLNSAIDGTIRDLAQHRVKKKYYKFTRDSTYTVRGKGNVEIKVSELRTDSATKNSNINLHSIEQSVIVKTDIEGAKNHGSNLNIDSLTKKLLEEVKKKTNRITEFDTSNFQNILFKNLKAQLLDSSVSFRIVDERNNELYRTTCFEMNKSLISKELYPGDIIVEPIHLQIYLNRGTDSFNSVIFPAILSFLFLLCCLWGFKWVYSSYLKERKLSEVKTNFINSMSHELKTPLATIDLSVQNLKKELISKLKRNQIYEIIQIENRRMQKYINSILQSVQVGNDVYRLKFETVQTEIWFKQTLERAKGVVTEANGTMQIQISRLPESIRIDPLHLENVFRNMIENAVKYSTVPPMISINISLENRHLVISVNDNGIGISKEDCRYIFDQFYRVTQGNLYTVKGTGIGLYYCKQIIELHQGKIGVASELGKGSTFNITIPLK